MNGTLAAVLAYVGIAAIALTLAVLATVLFAVVHRGHRRPSRTAYDLDVELQHKYLGGSR